MKTFTPTIYNEDNPVGLDYYILLIQKRLACIKWMEYIFGVAHLQNYLKDQNQAKSYLSAEEGLRGVDRYAVYFPQGRKLGGDIDLTFDDSYASRVFFYCKDPINFNPKSDKFDWTSGNVEISQHVSLIFHCNLTKLEVSGYEQVKLDLLYQLSKCPNVLILKDSFENVDNVWKEFTVNQDIAGVTKFPYYCIRIEMLVTYMAFPFNGNSLYDPSLNQDLTGLDIVQNQSKGLANTN